MPARKPRNKILHGNGGSASRIVPEPGPDVRDRSLKVSVSSLTGVFEPLINDRQAAALLGGIHPKTLQRLARGCQIPAYRLGRFWRYRASELDMWLRSRAQSAGQPVGVDFTKEDVE